MAEVFDFGLQQHKIKMDGKFFESNLFAVAGDTGRRLEVQLLDSDNMIQNTTGISLRLNANVAGQATYAEATLVDATKGLYELDLPNGMLIAPGNWQFQWQIIGATGEKLHSFAFVGSIGSNLSEGGAEATNFYLNVEDLKQMQDDLVNGTIDSSILETNITEKLTNLETQYAPKLNEVTAQLAQKADERFTMQSDYVSQVSRLIGGYEKMYYKRENTLGWVTVMLRKGLEHISYVFRNNEYDDYYILGDCFYGSVTESYKLSDSGNYDTSTGNWVTSSIQNYTTEVNATITKKIRGEKFEFTHYAAPNGGIFEFVLNGDTNNKVTVSTWSANASQGNVKVIFDGLEDKEHTIVGTFKGSDPNNPPEGGTARGWVTAGTVSSSHTFRSYTVQLSNNRELELLREFSNKEFAFRIKEAGTAHTPQFVPMHTAIGTAFNKSDRQFVVDGATVDNLSLPTSEFFECESFNLVQNVYGRNPESGDKNLVEISTNVSFSKDGNVEIAGKMKPLTSIEIQDGYGIMLPVKKEVTKRLLTSIGNEIPTLKTDGSSSYLTEEKDRTTSFAFLSDEFPNFIEAVRFNDPKESLRTDKTDKPSVGMTAWVEHRDTTMTKLYQSVYRNATLTPSDVFRWSGTINCAKIEGINNLL